MSFSEILARARDGDREARGELHRRYESIVLARLHERLSPLLRRHHETEELCQSVFVEVLGELRGFEDRGERAFKNWLYIKAENKVRAKLRKTLRPTGGRREQSLGAEIAARIPMREPGPATRVGEEEEQARVYRALSGLDEQDRQVIRLHAIEGRTFAEIAEELGFPSADAGRKRYARALVRLREICPSE